jgi:hypothetical protein
VGLISCVSKKHAHASEARDLYASPLFAKSREYVELNCDKWFILSAKYGLVAPGDVIDPYEETLNEKPVSERRTWANKLWAQLGPRLCPGDRVVVLAGERYREFLLPMITQHGCIVESPMQGLGIGRKLQWLTAKLSRPSREQHLEALYRSLRDLDAGLGSKRLISECTGKHGWPRSGVYFFFEPGECHAGGTEPRVVRVGTHGVSLGSQATLWNRLRTHRGTSGGLGNHRSSIFRLHVGAAFAARNPSMAVPSWGVGQTAPPEVRHKEEQLERAVSAHIGTMSILWLSVLDDACPSSDRAYLERNLIGLLVGRSGPADHPSPEWLGLSSPNDRIKRSGLWNLDFLEYQYSPAFLAVLQEYVSITLGKLPQPTTPIAPRGWYVNERNGIPNNQPSLFGEGER